MISENSRQAKRKQKPRKERTILLILTGGEEKQSRIMSTSHLISGSIVGKNTLKFLKSLKRQAKSSLIRCLRLISLASVPHVRTEVLSNGSEQVSIQRKNAYFSRIK